MQLSQATIDYIDRVTAVAQIAGIDAVVFRKDIVSGKDDTPAVVMVQKDDIPEFEFTELALIRIPYFRQRMEAVKATGKAFTATLEENKGLITFAAGRTKAEYRAGNAVAVRPPKGIAHTDTFTFPIEPDLVNIISRAAAAYPSKDPIVTLTSNGAEVELQITDDESNDSFTTIISDQMKGSGALSVRYPLKLLLPLLKQHEGKELKIGQIGSLALKIRGIDVFLIPRV
ncbi:hypothetical protein D3C75_726170 [compost metagenome]